MFVAFEKCEALGPLNLHILHMGVGERREGGATIGAEGRLAPSSPREKRLTCVNTSFSGWKVMTFSKACQADKRNVEQMKGMG